MKTYSVYIIQSEKNENRYYTGYSENFDERLKDHNRGHTTSSAKYRPWKLKTIINFTDKKKAKKFEEYLKTGSGRAFLKKHL